MHCFLTRLHTFFFSFFFLTVVHGQCNHHIFPINETEKRKHWVITKSHFYSQRQMIQSSEMLKNLKCFTGLLVPYKQVKVSQTLWMKRGERLSQLKQLYSMCKEVMLHTNEIMRSPVDYNQRIVFNQNNAYFNSRISRVSNTKHFI